MGLNDVQMITLHWTVGTYDQVFDGDYHFQILKDGLVHVDPKAFTAGSFNRLAHAWHHNSGNIGIALTAMYGAIEPSEFNPQQLGDYPSSYGAYPPTKEQYDTQCYLTALLMKHYGLTMDHVKTHYDLSLEDGYPGERWEFKYEKPLIVKSVSGMLKNVWGV